jgi:hypothetical protein
MIRSLIFILLNALWSLNSFANMSQPYTDGNDTSVIFGSRDCSVDKEHILIEFTPYKNPIYPESNVKWIAKYKITYHIISEKKGNMPLLFIARHLTPEMRTKILSNGKNIPFQTINKDNLSDFPFLKTRDSLPWVDIDFNGDGMAGYSVYPEELIYFSVDLNKGENVVYVEYNAFFEENRYGFGERYRLEYNLYPSRFWKSFGEIQIEVKMPKDITFFPNKSYNITDASVKNNILRCKTSISEESFVLFFEKKYSWWQEALTYIGPFGYAVIAALIVMYFQARWLIKKHSYWVLWLGSLVAMAVHYFAFLYAHDLIHFILNNGGKGDGYAVLYFIFLPIALGIYMAILLSIVYYIRGKRIMKGIR